MQAPDSVKSVFGFGGFIFGLGFGDFIFGLGFWFEVWGFRALILVTLYALSPKPSALNPGNRKV